VTKKHFTAIAWVIKTVLLKSIEAKSVSGADAAAQTARLLASEFGAINPNFKQEVFFKACGLEADGHQKTAV
jgi:hypothetical protein